MPRSSDELETPVATPRKRAVRKRASATRARATVSDREQAPVRKMAVEETPPQRVRSTDSEETKIEKRKAPTPFAGAKAAAINKKKHIIVATILMAFGFGASAMVGFTDEGQINVQKTIEDRNERIRNNQANERDFIGGRVEVPVQNTTVRQADGGLIGRGVGSGTTAPTPPVATSTATSSIETATSSEAVATSSEATAADTESEVDEAEEPDQAVLPEETTEQ
jgi:hypothetical protein